MDSQHAPYHQFSVMWSNNGSHTRPMSHQTVTLRDAGGPGQLHGLSAKELHLDQVTVWFRPSDQIATGEFVTGDTVDFSWTGETRELMVRTRPGHQFALHAVSNIGSDHMGEDTIREPQRSLQYSVAMSQVPNTGSLADATARWIRTYRPIRDLPLFENLTCVSELEIELLWPALFADKDMPYQKVPDYRILKVLCQFSAKH